MTRNIWMVMAAIPLSFLLPYSAVGGGYTPSVPAKEVKKVVTKPKIKYAPPAPNKKAPVVLDESLKKRIGVDGYLFEKEDYPPLTDLKIKMVYYDTLAELHQKAGEPKDSSLVAYTFPPSAENGFTCEIHVVDPRKLYWPEYIGHEFVHCLAGNFHRVQDEVGKFDPTK